MLEIGDRVRIRKSQHKWFKYMLVGDTPTNPSEIGTVISVDLWESDGQLTAENHGTIEVKYPNGYVEHFCAYNWNECLEKCI